MENTLLGYDPIISGKMAALEQIVASNPEDYVSWFSLASSRLASSDVTAEAAMDRARYLMAMEVFLQSSFDMARIANDPTYCREMGVALYQNGMVVLASVLLAKSIDLQDLNLNDLLTYGLSLQHQGRIDEAVSVFRLLGEVSDNPEAYQFLIYILFQVPDRLRAVSEEARAWAARFGSVAPASRVSFSNSRDLRRKLKIGYFAPFFTRSQVSPSLMPVIENHDPEAFDIYVYCRDPSLESSLPSFCKVRGLGALDDNSAAELIRSDELDVLVDVWGHTSGSRLRLFSMRMAPVQVGWMNFMHTTGLDTLDYTLHSDLMDVPGTQEFFNETIWRTGLTMAPYRPHLEDIELVQTPALTNGYVTFGSFNNPIKLSDQTVAAWSAILRARSNDRLLLKYRYFMDPVLQAVVRSRFAAYGVSADRIDFDGHSTGDDYMRAFHRIDLALDPSPSPGGTTTLDAITHGVPVLVLKGEDFYARTSLPLLIPCGLEDLVVENWSDYVEKALSLTSNYQALEELRRSVRPGFDNSLYREERGFTRHLEGIFRDMFKIWVDEVSGA